MVLWRPQARVDCPVRSFGSAPATLKYRSTMYLRSLADAASRNIVSVISFDVPYGEIG
jgi:hypothetical protein